MCEAIEAAGGAVPDDAVRQPFDAPRNPRSCVRRTSEFTPSAPTTRSQPANGSSVVDRRCVMSIHARALALPASSTHSDRRSRRSEAVHRRRRWGCLGARSTDRPRLRAPPSALRASAARRAPGIRARRARRQTRTERRVARILLDDADVSLHAVASPAARRADRGTCACNTDAHRGRGRRDARRQHFNARDACNGGIPMCGSLRRKKARSRRALRRDGTVSRQLTGLRHERGRLVLTGRPRRRSHGHAWQASRARHPKARHLPPISFHVADLPETHTVYVHDQLVRTVQLAGEARRRSRRCSIHDVALRACPTSRDLHHLAVDRCLDSRPRHQASRSGDFDALELDLRPDIPEPAPGASGPSRRAVQAGRSRSRAAGDVADDGTETGGRRAPAPCAAAAAAAAWRRRARSGPGALLRRDRRRGCARSPMPDGKAGLTPSSASSGSKRRSRRPMFSISSPSGSIGGGGMTTSLCTIPGTGYEASLIVGCNSRRGRDRSGGRGDTACRPRARTTYGGTMKNPLDSLWGTVIAGSC